MPSHLFHSPFVDRQEGDGAMSREQAVEILCSFASSVSLSTRSIAQVC